MKVEWIEAGEAAHLTAESGDPRDALGWIGDLPLDVSTRPPRLARLMAADMDSTIIACECLDELADFAGRKAEVAAITERAMAGELDFEAALDARVGMLKGLPLDALQACFEQRVRLNPGAKVLVRTLSALGTRTVLVSGGFTFFTERVAHAAGFQAHHANTLLDDGRALTGAVARPILGRAAKLDTLRAAADGLGLALSDTMAIGDGANDLDMIEAAGLGVAWRAKPVVAERAAAKIAHGGLESALFFQGIARKDFVAG